MTTLATTLKVLDAQGFVTQFQVTAEGLKSLTTQHIYKPEQVKIVDFHRFEGESNPDDSSILYAIETNSKERGTLIDSYGSDNDANITAFIKGVEGIHKKEKNQSI